MGYSYNPSYSQLLRRWKLGESYFEVSWSKKLAKPYTQ
jgi:hypothetical protein